MPHDTEPTPATVVTCTCTCGCTNQVALKIPSAALARHARCQTCGTEEHVRQHRGTRMKTTEPDAGTRITSVYVPTPEEKAVAKAARDAYKKELWDAAWERWQQSIPEKFRNASPNLPQLRRNIARIRSGATAVSGSIIGGEVGRGKTWEAVGFANTAIKERLLHPSEVLFGTESELLSSVANSPFADVEAGLRRLTSGRYRLIIIDDVGRGTWLREEMRPKVFSRVFDNMWSNNHIVVITTNLDLPLLKEYVGTAAWDRLRSMVGLDSILLDAVDKREETTRQILATVKDAEENPF